MYFKVYYSSYSKPVEVHEDRRYVVKFLYSDMKSICSIFNLLKFLSFCIGKAKQEKFPLVKPADN